MNQLTNKGTGFSHEDLGGLEDLETLYIIH